MNPVRNPFRTGRKAVQIAIHNLRRERVRVAGDAETNLFDEPGVDVLFVLARFGNRENRLAEVAAFSDELIAGRRDHPVACRQIADEFGREFAKVKPGGEFRPQLGTGSVDAHVATAIGERSQDPHSDTVTNVGQHEPLVRGDEPLDVATEDPPCECDVLADALEPVGVKRGNDRVRRTRNHPLDRQPGQPRVGAQKPRQRGGFAVYEFVLIVDARDRFVQSVGNANHRGFEVGQKQVGGQHSGEPRDLAYVAPHAREPVAAGVPERRGIVDPSAAIREHHPVDAMQKRITARGEVFIRLAERKDVDFAFGELLDYGDGPAGVAESFSRDPVEESRSPSILGSDNSPRSGWRGVLVPASELELRLSRVDHIRGAYVSSLSIDHSVVKSLSPSDEETVDAR